VIADRLRCIETRVMFKLEKSDASQKAIDFADLVHSNTKSGRRAAEYGTGFARC